MIGAAVRLIGGAGKIGGALWKGARIAREVTKGFTTYINPGLPRVLHNSVRQFSQMLGVEFVAPNQAIFDGAKETIETAARGVTFATVGVAFACVAIGAPFLGMGAGMAGQVGLANSLQAVGRVAGNNGGQWAENVAATVGGFVNAQTDPWDPAHANPADPEGAIAQDLFDNDDAAAGDSFPNQYEAARAQMEQNRSNG